MIKYFCPLMMKEEKSIFASISAKVGSISDNYLGGWYSYRASKAALNQIIKTSSIEQKRFNKNLIMVSVHPGTVNTRLSNPFIGKRKVQTPSEAAIKIIDLLETLTIEDSGLFFDYNKNIIFEGGNIVNNENICLVNINCLRRHNQQQDYHAIKNNLESFFEKNIHQHLNFIDIPSITGDDTNGHIDNLVRFYDDAILLMSTNSQHHPDYEKLKKLERKPSISMQAEA